MIALFHLDLYWCPPHFPILKTDLLRHKERMEALTITLAEMSSIIAKHVILEALTKNIAPAVNQIYNLGEEKRVYSKVRKA